MFFCLFALYIISLPSGLQKVSAEKWADSLFISYLWWVSFLLLLSRFFVWLFGYSVSWIDLFGFILLGVYLASWICRFTSFSKLWQFSATISHFFKYEDYVAQADLEPLGSRNPPISASQVAEITNIHYCAYWLLYLQIISQSFSPPLLFAGLIRCVLVTTVYW